MPSPLETETKTPSTNKPTVVAFGKCWWVDWIQHQEIFSALVHNRSDQQVLESTMMSLCTENKKHHRLLLSMIWKVMGEGDLHVEDNTSEPEMEKDISHKKKMDKEMKQFWNGLEMNSSLNKIEQFFHAKFPNHHNPTLLLPDHIVFILLNIVLFQFENQVALWTWQYLCEHNMLNVCHDFFFQLFSYFLLFKDHFELLSSLPSSSSKKSKHKHTTNDWCNCSSSLSYNHNHNHKQHFYLACLWRCLGVMSCLIHDKPGVREFQLFSMLNVSSSSNTNNCSAALVKMIRFLPSTLTLSSSSAAPLSCSQWSSTRMGRLMYENLIQSTSGHLMLWCMDQWKQELVSMMKDAPEKSCRFYPLLMRWMNALDTLCGYTAFGQPFCSECSLEVDFKQQRDLFGTHREAAYQCLQFNGSLIQRMTRDQDRSMERVEMWDKTLGQLNGSIDDLRRELASVQSELKLSNKKGRQLKKDLKQQSEDIANQLQELDQIREQVKCKDQEILDLVQKFESLSAAGAGNEN